MKQTSSTTEQQQQLDNSNEQITSTTSTETSSRKPLPGHENNLVYDPEKFVTNNAGNLIKKETPIQKPEIQELTPEQKQTIQDRIEIQNEIIVRNHLIHPSYPFRSPLNNIEFPKRYETLPSKQPSKTIPDQSLSVKEIMTRYAKGLPLAGQRVPEYNGEDDVLNGINFKSLDISEQHELMQLNAERIKDMQQQLQDRVEKKRLDTLREQFKQEQSTTEAPSASQAPTQENQ